LACWACVPLFW